MVNIWISIIFWTAAAGNLQKATLDTGVTIKHISTQIFTSDGDPDKVLASATFHGNIINCVVLSI